MNETGDEVYWIVSLSCLTEKRIAKGTLEEVRSNPAIDKVFLGENVDVEPGNYVIGWGYMEEIWCNYCQR